MKRILIIGMLTAVVTAVSLTSTNTVSASGGLNDPNCETECQARYDEIIAGCPYDPYYDGGECAKAAYASKQECLQGCASLISSQPTLWQSILVQGVYLVVASI